jgi:hypothetical protein
MAKLVKIEGLLDSADRKFFSGAQLRPDPALVADGWERRFTTDAQRAEEVIELYLQSGFEVRAEPVRSVEVHDDCTDCQSVILSKFKTIYTRRRAI